MQSPDLPPCTPELELGALWGKGLSNTSNPRSVLLSVRFGAVEPPRWKRGGYYRPRPQEMHTTGPRAVRWAILERHPRPGAPAYVLPWGSRPHPEFGLPPARWEPSAWVSCWVSSWGTGQLLGPLATQPQRPEGPRHLLLSVPALWEHRCPGPPVTGLADTAALPGWPAAWGTLGLGSLHPGASS